MDDTQLLDLIRNRFFGKYRGTVVETDDPAGRGRVKVRVPAVTGELTLWAMPCVPYAGPGVGFFALPDTGAGVWVEFEAGDPSFPIWVGCFWAADELPEELPDSAPAPVKLLRTPGGMLKIDDGKHEVELSSADAKKVKASVKLDDEIVATSKGGASVTVTGDAVMSEGQSAKLAVGPGSVSANDGALEVS